MAFPPKKDKGGKPPIKKKPSFLSKGDNKFSKKPPEKDDEEDDESAPKGKFGGKEKYPAEKDNGKNLPPKQNKPNDRFKKPQDDEDEDDDGNSKGGKKGDWQANNATKNTDQDVGDVEKTDLDKKRGDTSGKDAKVDDDENQPKGKCNCGRQIELNPPLRSQYEEIANLPPFLQEDALAALVKENTTKIRESISAKAEACGFPYEVVFEVFRRGWYSGRGADHLTEYEIGFNRVNSFLAGGLARKLDEDLIQDMDIKGCSLEEDMGINTPSDDLVGDTDEPLIGDKLKSRMKNLKKRTK